MTELKPCPFCGGGASLRSEWMSDGYGYTAVVCTECGAIMPGNYSAAGDQATWDWNDRYERTCQMKEARWDDGQCTWGVICSSCGHKHDHKFENSFNFCPNCGANVVDE